jgi:hypothetical protein
MFVGHNIVVTLPFLDRVRELGRLRAALDGDAGSLLVVYGRRRLGKSRLVREALADRPAVYYVADEEDAPLQRSALAREVARLLPGFGDVTYPAWAPLLERFWEDAPAGAVLALDEMPWLVASAPEIPSLLQRLLDRPSRRPRHVVLSGSSQRLMHGLVLDAAAPLYGRAREILKLEPLGAGWLGRALGLGRADEVVDHFAVWGGVPRYWELARGCADRATAVAALALDPLGVLHREPDRLLLDEVGGLARPASILALVGQGCGRLSEIAGRLALPATSLTRPLALLCDLGFLHRETPFGRSLRDSKRSYYRVADPFLRFWFRFVAPNRSRLEAGQIAAVTREVDAAWPGWVGGTWEDLARAAVPRLDLGPTTFSVAGRWWGPGVDGRPLELDLVAEAVAGPPRLLVGEAKRSAAAAEARVALAELRRKAARCPLAAGREVEARLFVLHGPRNLAGVVSAPQVLAALR